MSFDNFLLYMREIKEKEAKTLKPRGEREKKILSMKDSLKEKPIIAEIKRSSPTVGTIKLVEPIEQAELYVSGGAGAISVLVDSNFFSGNWEQLNLVSKNFSIPILCKEFIVNESQIDMAFLRGADCILLIGEMLSEDELVRLSSYAKKLGMEVLFEIHEDKSVEKLKLIEPDMVGINSRNLKTLKVEKEAAERMISYLKDKYFIVAESGIKSIDDIKKLTMIGARAFLIGETLMKLENPAEFIKEATVVYKDLRHKRR